MASDTKQRILAAARELFAEKGVQKTSLQEIADRLGITKPALYYHFGSREDLLRSIIQPMIDAGWRFVEKQEKDQEKASTVEARALLEGFFDFHYEHRTDLLLVLSEVSTIVELGLIDLVLAWRVRMIALLFGPTPTLEQSARAVTALGGIHDCILQLADAPHDELRAATVTAAMAALGLPD